MSEEHRVSQVNKNFAIRKVRTGKLDVHAGVMTFDLVEFRATIKDLLHYHDNGYNISFDVNIPRVICKRPLDKTIDGSGESSKSNEVAQSEYFDNGNGSDIGENYQNYLKALQQMDLIGRKEDFLSFIKTVADGILNTNVGLHFSLDIGRFF